MSANLVWYAAYGSNLSEERFRFYIEGGRPEGAAVELRGCRDRRRPAETRPFLAPGRLVFGKHSTNWGGGVAFLDLEASGQAYCRLYLITPEQFLDVAAQENRLEVGSLHLDLPAGGRERDIGAGFYPLVVNLGELEGRPVLTITDRGVELRPPSKAYLRWVTEGLRTAHDLDERTLNAYLEAAGAFWED